MAEAKHAERRRRLGKVVVDVIARDGYDAATIRRIASEVGYSTAVVTHYFSDKNDMLHGAYRTFADGGTERYDEVVRKNPADLLGYLLSMNSLDPTDIALWRAYVAVWDKSLRDPIFAEELASWIKKTLTRIEGIIAARNPTCRDAPIVAKHLLALVQGMSVQVLFDSQSWSLAVMRERIAAEIETLLGPPEGG